MEILPFGVYRRSSMFLDFTRKQSFLCQLLVLVVIFVCVIRNLKKKKKDKCEAICCVKGFFGSDYLAFQLL